MKHLKVLVYKNNEGFNSAHYVVVEDEKVTYSGQIVYSEKFDKEQVKTEIQNDIEEDIIDFSISFDWVGGRPNDRK